MIDSLPTCAEFDYGQYEPELADELRQAAERIRSRGQDQIAAIVDIGNELIQVKNMVGHGNWGPWLKSEFAMSVATADRYMRVAAFIADKRTQGKFVTVTNLTPGLLFQMSAKSAPPLLVHEAVERAETNAPMSEREFRSRLATLKKAKRTVTIGAATEAAQHQEDTQPVSEQGTVPQGFGRQHEAANAAVSMLRESLGDQFPTFVALFEEADIAFSSALRGSAILSTTIRVASTTEVNLQPAAAAAEPPAPEPGEHGCPEFLDPVTPTVLSVSEPQPAQGDKQTREAHKVQELRKSSAEASVRELRISHEDSPPKTMTEGLPMRIDRVLALSASPPGVRCGHKRGICGYSGCLPQGRCLANPGSVATAQLRPVGASSAIQLPREPDARRNPAAAHLSHPAPGRRVAVQANTVSLGK
jgi:hypothetical protein